jgi:uncharacterized protein (DUF2236 family)
VIDTPLPPELGLFGPDSVTWRISRELGVLLAGGSRALLLQVAHPKVAAAVADHSRYRSDPLGRLRDTLDAIYAFSFEDTRKVERVVRRVNALHGRVHGQTPDGAPYSALDPHLLLWVYATLVDTPLLAYETFVQPLTPGERAAYYREVQRVAGVWGIPPRDVPDSLESLRAWMADLIARGDVHVTPQGRQVGRYILEPPVWWLPPLAALPLRLVTVWLLPEALRSGFGYRWDPRREKLMRTLAATSRRVVPHLPHVVRDLPIARTAQRRARGVAFQPDAGRQRRSGSTGGARGASSAGA